MKKLGAAIGLLTCAALPSVGFASEQEGWQFELTPYLWAFGIDGDLYAGEKKASFSKDFSDITENMDGGGSLLFAGSYNRFVFMAQYDFASFDPDGENFRDRAQEFGSNAKVEGDFDTKIATAAVGYRFDTFGENNWVDVMVGARQLKLDTKMKVTGDVAVNPPTDPPTTSRVTRTFQGEPDVTDAIIMLRPSFRISEHWRFNPTMSYAVGGDSETHYELSPQFQWQFSDYFALRVGYRDLAYDIEEGSEHTTKYRRFDGDIAGAMIGVGWTFPKHEKPVVAAAPAPAPKPAPAAARPPADSDGDGVIDSND